MRGWSGFDRVVLLGLLVFVAVGLGPSLVGRDVAIDTNLLTQFQPWRSQTGVDIVETNVCRSDTVDVVLPTLAVVRRDLSAGEYPTWAQNVVGGAPLTAPNVGQFSPLALPYYVLPLSWAPAAVKLLQLLTVVLGMVAFLRRLGVSRAGGLLASVVYGSSAFMIMWTNWPQTQTAAFVPALFWAAERLVSQPRSRPRDAVPLGLGVAAMLLSGFPAVTGMALYVAAAYFLVRLVALHRRDLRAALTRTALAAGGIVGGVLLTAFQLVPFAQQLGAMDLSYRDSVKGQFAPLYTLLTTLSPDILGTCVNGQQYGSNSPIEAAAFVGAATVVLAVVPLLWRRGRWAPPGHVVWFFTAITVLCVVVGWYGGPLLDLVQRLPVFSNSLIWRVRVILGFTVAVLAALGLDRALAFLADRRPRGRGGRGGGPPDGAVPRDTATTQPDGSTAGSPSGPRAWVGSRSPLEAFVVLLLVLGAAYTAYATLLSGRANAISGSFYLQWRGATLGAGAVVAAAVVLLLVVRLAPRYVARPALAAVVALVVVQGAQFFAVDVGGSDPENFYPVTPTHAFLQQHQGHDRFAASDLIALPPTAGYYDLRTPTGHQFAEPEWTDLLTTIDPTVMKSPTFSDFSSGKVPTSQVGRNPLLDRLAVQYWVSNDGDVPGTLDAPAASGSAVPATSGRPLSCTLPAGALRGVVVRTVGALPAAPAPGPGAAIDVSVRTADGKVLTGARDLEAGAPAATPLPVGVPGETLTAADGALTVTVTVTGTVGSPTLTGSGAALSCGRVTPADDGIRLVDSHRGALVWQRLTSLPRIRWAGGTVVEPDGTRQVAKLRDGVPADTVVLGSGTAAAATGAPATVQVLTDADGEIAAQVQAPAAGHLVVADALADRGWSAQVDGRSVPLVRADHAMAAVAVPAGNHTVTLRYDAPGLRTGVLLSGVGVVLLLAALVPWRRRRRGAAAAARDA